MKNIVEVVKTEDGAYIHPVEGEKPDYGMIKFHQPSSRISGRNFMNKLDSKWVTIPGQVQGLENFLNEFMDEEDKVPGRIFIREFPESKIPEEYKKAFFVKGDVDPCERFLKKAGNAANAPILMYGNDRICTFKIYVRLKSKWQDLEDEFLEHTNKDEVDAWREANNISAADINDMPDLS